MSKDAMSALAELTGLPTGEPELQETPVAEASEEPKFAEKTEEVLESEEVQEPEDAENSDTEPASAETSEEDSVSPEEEDEKPVKYAGKYDSVSDLERGYQESNRAATQLSQQISQQRQHLTALRAQVLQAQQAAIPSRPPAFDQLVKSDQEYYAEESERTGIPAELIIRQDWLRKRDEIAQEAQLAQYKVQKYEEAQTDACNRLHSYVVNTYKGDQILKDLESERPEFFQVLDHLHPDAIEQFGKYIVDTRAENVRLKAQLASRDKAVRQQVRTETKEIRQSKQTGRSEAARAGSSPPVSATPAKTSKSPIDEFCERWKI